jgi:hypothetical protein
MNVYVDESGDLGWSFNKPHNQGGSSRHVTIAALIVPKPLSPLSKRIVKKTYIDRKQSTKVELKGRNLSKHERVRFAERVVRLLQREPSIKISVITVYKRHVQEHIRTDANKLYNYMVNFALLDTIKNYPVVTFIPDPRTIKVASGNSLLDYLQIKLWFEHNSATVIKHVPMESHRSLNLQFIDFVSYIVWNHHENNESSAWNVLKPWILRKLLFF